MIMLQNEAFFSFQGIYGPNDNKSREIAIYSPKPSFAIDDAQQSLFDHKMVKNGGNRPNT